MTTTTFATITAFQVIFFSKTAVSFRGQVIVSVLEWDSFSLKIHSAKIQFLIFIP